LWRKEAGVAERLHRLTIAAVLLTLALGIGVATALAATAFPDPVGDVQGGPGPDITSVVVSHTASTVSFRFRFASAPPLGLSARARAIGHAMVTRRLLR
jgi:hypothetical protein